MTTPTTETTTTTTTLKERRPIRAAQLIHDLEHEAPELFQPDYDAEGITDALIADGLPAPVVREVLLSFVQWRRGDFRPRQPALTPAERKEAAERREAQAIERAAAAKWATLTRIDAGFVMADGRRLGDWTIAELRYLGGVFAFILAKAGESDDKRTVDQIMAAGDWKELNAKQ